jgi:hypothetical protein
MAKVTVIGRTRLGGKQPYGEVIWDGEKLDQMYSSLKM